MGGNDACLEADIEFGQLLGRKIHRRPVRLAAHDDAHPGGLGRIRRLTIEVEFFAHSGNIIRYQAVLDEVDLVLEDELALLEPL